MSKTVRIVAATLAAASAIAAAPAAGATERTELTITTMAAGPIGDTFECGGVIGRLWCK